MPFDPSIISQIPDSAPNPVEAKAQGFKLADLINTEQLNKLRLNQVQTEQNESLQMKEILKKEDLSTPQGITKAAQALNKAGMGEKSMKLMGMAQQYQTGQVEQETAQLKLQAERHDAMSGALDNVYGQLLNMQKAGATPEMLDFAAAKLAGPAMQQLEQEVPELKPMIEKFKANPQNLTFAGIKSAEAMSNRGQAMLKERLAERAQETKEKTESERERKDRSDEAFKAQKAAEAAAGAFDDDTVKSMAEQYIAGDKSVLTGLGRGTQGARNIVAVRKEITAQAKAQGLTGADLAAKMAEFNATVAEERKIGNISGGVEFASAELDRFIPLAEAASAKVPRGKFVPFTSLIQRGEANISDPDLKRLYVNTQGVMNAYDVLAARGGSDKDKREHNRQMLLTADSPEAYKVALDSIRQEIHAAKGAGKQAKANVAAEVSGKDTKTLTYDPATGTFK